LAEVNVGSDKSVAYLAEVIINELPSLATVDPSAMTLHLAEVDGKGKVKSICEDALDARKSLADAGVVSGASIVAKVAGAAPWAAANGACSV